MGKGYFKVTSTDENTVFDNYLLSVLDNNIDYDISSESVLYTGDVIDETGVAVNSPRGCVVEYAKEPISSSSIVYQRPAFYKYPGRYNIYFNIINPDTTFVKGFFILRIRGIQVTGSVISALTGLGVGSAGIVFSIKDTQEQVKTLTVDANGEFDDEFPPNVSLVANVSCSGYIPGTFEFDVGTSVLNLDPFVLVPDRGDVITIVLTWGENPKDLDSHLKRYSTGGKTPFEIYYQNKSYVEGGDLIAELDLDSTQGKGPETTTIYDYSGEFEFFVKDYYTTSDPINATVRIFLPGSVTPVVVTCNQVLGSLKWVVCTIVDGVVTVVNTVTS